MIDRIVLASLLCSIGFSTAGIAERGRLRGEVRTEERQPVVGASVVAVRREAPPVAALTVTDANGFLGIDDVPSGEYDLLVIAPGFEPGRVAGLEVGGPFRSVVDVTLRRGTTEAPAIELQAGNGEGSGSITVVGESGEPLPTVLVRLDPVGHRHDPVRELTGADGRVRVGDLGAGAWKLSILKPGWTRLRVPSLSVEGGEVEMLARILPLSGLDLPEPVDLLPAPGFPAPAEPLPGTDPGDLDRPEERIDAPGDAADPGAGAAEEGGAGSGQGTDPGDGAAGPETGGNAPEDT